MAIITLPSGILFSEFRLGRVRFDYEEASAETGAISARVRGNPRWTAAIRSPDKMTDAQAGLWIGMVLKLRDRLNHLALYDVVNQSPVGTMRGTMTLSADLAAGATSCTITAGAGQASTTLKALDRLQIGTGLGSQLIVVTDDATANGSGVISVAFEHPARVAFASGTAVTWDKPLAYFKQVGDGVSWGYDAGFLTRSGVALDLAEQWT